MPRNTYTCDLHKKSQDDETQKYEMYRKYEKILKYQKYATRIAPVNTTAIYLTKEVVFRVFLHIFSSAKTQKELLGKLWP